MLEHAVLIVEDDRALLEEYHYVLKRHFAEVYQACDGKEALACYEKHTVDILIIDIQLPLLDGLTLAKQIRRQDPKIPIFILSGYSDKTYLFEAIALKVDGYFVKPLDPQALVDRLLERFDHSWHLIHLQPHLTWDPANQILRYRDTVIYLTKKERDLITFLLRTPNRFVSVDAIIYHVWGDEMIEKTHYNKAVQLIYRLKRKVEDATRPRIKLIENGYLQGYRIITVS